MREKVLTASGKMIFRLRAIGPPLVWGYDLLICDNMRLLITSSRWPSWTQLGLQIYCFRISYHQSKANCQPSLKDMTNIVWSQILHSFLGAALWIGPSIILLVIVAFHNNPAFIGALFTNLFRLWEGMEPRRPQVEAGCISTDTVCIRSFLRILTSLEDTVKQSGTQIAALLKPGDVTSKQL